MAKKNIQPLEDPPIATSSDDEEVESSSGEEEEDESDSSSEEAAAVTVTSNNTPVKPAVSESDSDSGSETESGSDTETEEEPSKPVAVTTAAKPKNKEVRGSGAAQSSAAASAPPALKSVLKRSTSEGTSTPMKRAKTVSGDVEKSIGEESKRPLFQRVWSEDDEITLLQAMIEFNASTGKSPYDNMNGFFDSVKTSFSFGPSKIQFTEKIRGLKNKYLSKVNNGVEPSFTKDHDKKSMGLAKRIWGFGGFANESAVKSSNGKYKKSEKKKLDSFKLVEEEEEEEEKDVLVPARADPEPHTVGKFDWFETSFLVQSIASYGLDEDYVKQKWISAPMEDKKKLEDKYKLLRAKEVEYVLLKTKFLHEVSSLIFKSS